MIYCGDVGYLINDSRTAVPIYLPPKLSIEMLLINTDKFIIDLHFLVATYLLVIHMISSVKYFSWIHLTKLCFHIMLVKAVKNSAIIACTE